MSEPCQNQKVVLNELVTHFEALCLEIEVCEGDAYEDAVKWEMNVLIRVK